MSDMENTAADGREVERAVGERNGVAVGRDVRAGVPDPELVEGPKRRRFTAEYKLAILREADACSRPGEIGALLTISRRRRPPEPRPRRPRPVPARALTQAEREKVLEVLHSQRFVDCSPAQVWATLLDEGRYLASERTFYRLLGERGEVRER